MFAIINGIQVSLADYIEDEDLVKELENDQSFISAVSFGFEKEYSFAEDETSGDEILERVIYEEIKKRN